MLLDLNLDPKWSYSFMPATATGLDDNLVSLIPATLDYSIYLGGTFNKAPFVMSGTSKTDIVIAKISESQGNIIWSNLISSPDYDCL